MQFAGEKDGPQLAECIERETLRTISDTREQADAQRLTGYSG